MKRVTAMTGVFTPLGRQVFLQRGHVQKGTMVRLPKNWIECAGHIAQEGLQRQG